MIKVESSNIQKHLKTWFWPLWTCSLYTAQWSKTCNRKLAIGVNGRVNSCLLLCVSPVTHWLPVHAVPFLHDSWDRLQLIQIPLVIMQTLKWSVVSVCLAQLCCSSAHSRGLLVLACRGSSITCPNTILSLFLTVKKPSGWFSKMDACFPSPPHTKTIKMFHCLCLRSKAIIICDN